MGDLRGLQRSESAAPSDVNSNLARFFAEKGSAPLSAEERQQVNELLGGNTTAQAAAVANVPTALTPNFSFNSPIQSRASPNASVGSFIIWLHQPWLNDSLDTVPCVQASYFQFS